jgi:hypothetical protein
MLYAVIQPQTALSLFSRYGPICSWHDGQTLKSISYGEAIDIRDPSDPLKSCQECTVSIIMSNLNVDLLPLTDDDMLEICGRVSSCKRSCPKSMEETEEGSCWSIWI